MIKFLFKIFFVSFSIISLSLANKNEQKSINNLAYQGYSSYSSSYDGYCRSNHHCKVGLICNLIEYRCKCPNGQQL